MSNSLFNALKMFNVLNLASGRRFFSLVHKFALVFVGIVNMNYPICHVYQGRLGLTKSYALTTVNLIKMSYNSLALRREDDFPAVLRGYTITEF